jgi:hypothetical protein
VLFGNPCELRLEQFGFRSRERFLYQYNFFDEWRLDVRLKARSHGMPKGATRTVWPVPSELQPESDFSPWKLRSRSPQLLALMARIDEFADLGVGLISLRFVTVEGG